MYVDLRMQTHEILSGSVNTFNDIDLPAIWPVGAIQPNCSYLATNHFLLNIGYLQDGQLPHTLLGI